MSEDVKQFLDFTCAYGRCVCQLINRQSSTKAKAGTLPHFCCRNKLFWESVQQLNSIEENESKEEMCNEETEHTDDDSRSSDN